MESKQVPGLASNHCESLTVAAQPPMRDVVCFFLLGPHPTWKKKGSLTCMAQVSMHLLSACLPACPMLPCVLDIITIPSAGDLTQRSLFPSAHV